MNAIEALKEAQHDVAVINKKAEAVRSRIASANDVIAAYAKAVAEHEAIKVDRKERLAAIHLGKGKPDLSDIDKELSKSSVRVNALLDAHDGAQAALDTLNEELNKLENESWQLAQSLPDLKYAAALAEAESLIVEFQKSTYEAEIKLAACAGSFMALEKLRQSDTVPYAWLNNFSLEISFPDLPLLNCNGYQGYRSHVRLIPAANDAKDQFSERLAKLGII